MSGEYGDDTSFAEMLSHYERWLKSVANAMTRRHPEDFEDLVQEGRIAIWNSLDSYDPAQGTLAPWVTTAAKMRMSDCVRRRIWTGMPSRVGKRPGLESGATSNAPVVKSLDEWLYSDPSGTELMLEAADLLDAALLAYHRGEIYAAINELPPRQKEYVVLRFWGGFNETEIQELTGYSVSVRNLWLGTKTAARPLLRAKLEHLVGVG
jgi:RNA polymerase sigma factor (sigma-70 family)